MIDLMLTRGLRHQSEYEKPTLRILDSIHDCTALVVGSDDVASSYCIGVLMGRLAGRREGSRGAHVVARC